MSTSLLATIFMQFDILMSSTLGPRWIASNCHSLMGKGILFCGFSPPQTCLSLGYSITPRTLMSIYSNFY